MSASGSAFARAAAADAGRTRVFRHLRAPRDRVYAAFLDPDAVRQWKVPAGMTAQIHSFDGREGGTYRVSLTYDAPTTAGTTAGKTAGKTSGRTDTYQGRFVRLVHNRRIVEQDEFETDDPAFQGEMTIIIELADANRDGVPGTDLVAIHEGLPPGVSRADNDAGWRMALAKLATLVEEPRGNS